MADKFYVDYSDAHSIVYKKQIGGNTVKITLYDTDGDGVLDENDIGRVSGVNPSIFNRQDRREIHGLIKKGINGTPYNEFDDRNPTKLTNGVLYDKNNDKTPTKTTVDDAKCGYIEADKDYRVRSIYDCYGGMHDTAPKLASDVSKKHSGSIHTAKQKTSSANKVATVEPTIDASANAALAPTKEEKPATPPETASPAVTSAPAPTTTTTTTTPAPAAQTSAPAATNKPAPATAAAAPPAPAPVPQRYPAPPQQQGYSYPPAYSTGFDSGSMLFGLMGGMGLMAMLDGLGGGHRGGGFFGIGGYDFLGGGLSLDFGFGGYGFQHPHHMDGFAFRPHHLGGYEFHNPHNFGHEFRYEPHFGRYGSFHHEPPIAFNHGNNGGFEAHHGGFGMNDGGFGGITAHHGGFSGGFGGGFSGGITAHHGGFRGFRG